MRIFLLLSLILLSFSTSAYEEDCEYPVYEPIIDPVNMKMLQTTGNAIKENFKRRPVNVKGFHLALSIETNFHAPLIGKNKYWGRIYLKDGDPQNVAYRDDLIAEKHYKNESQNPGKINYSNFKVSDINSSKGLSLVDAAGAEVNVKSVGSPFTTASGGRLSVKVKAPGQSSRTLVMDVVRANGKISNYLIINNRRIPFDSFKINASKNLFGVTTILAGVKDIQFYSGGKVVHTL